MSQAGISMTDGKQAPAITMADSPLRQFVRRFRRQKMAVGALAVILLLFVLSLLGPAIAPYDPIKPDYSATLQSPCAKHLLGTDEFGRDVLSRIINGARISMSVSFEFSLYWCGDWYFCRPYRWLLWWKI